MAIDWTKPVELVSNKGVMPARVLCTDRKEGSASIGTRPRPVIVLIYDKNTDKELIRHSALDGQTYQGHSFRNVREKAFVNVYKDFSKSWQLINNAHYVSLKCARESRRASTERLGTFEIYTDTWEIINFHKEGQ